MAEIGVIGSGSWGTALALVLNKNGHHVTIWSYLKEEADEIREKRENPSKLPGVPIPEEIEITTDLQGSVEGKDVVVLAVPSMANIKNQLSLKANDFEYSIKKYAYRIIRFPRIYYMIYMFKVLYMKFKKNIKG